MFKMSLPLNMSNSKDDKFEKPKSFFFKYPQASLKTASLKNKQVIMLEIPFYGSKAYKTEEKNMKYIILYSCFLYNY